VEGNTSSRNNGNGIVVGAGCLIRNNTSENNGTVVGASTAAIIVSGSFNRIDGNNVMGSTFGITVANGLVNNTAIRNTATLCTTPYNFPTGVSYGAIINLPSGPFTDSNSFANLRF
jgi:parallel beta-helix repeat protein